ncbi:MAG: PilC/PilY family type IV pilus protein [Candidatus Thiodiazotropha sp.]|jgi:type IV pilus assembly protein PilY1
MTCSNLAPNYKHFLPALALALPLFFSSPIALPDDIEVYLQEPKAVPSNILFVMDESASMEFGSVNDQPPKAGELSRRDQLVAALTTIFNDPAMGNINAALLGYHIKMVDGKKAFDIVAHSGNFKFIKDNRAAFLEQINALSAFSNTPTVPALNAAVNWYRPDVQFIDTSGTSVASPLEGVDPENGYCIPNHIILLTDGQPNKNDIDTYNGVACADSGLVGASKCAVEIATWANNTDLMEGAGWYGKQNITIHTVGFYTNNETQKFLSTIAEVGGGDAYESDGGSLVEDLSNIITTAQSSVEYAYNAPAIPFNSDNAAVTGENIFVPIFLPDVHTFWKGNLKKYRLVLTDEKIELKALGDELAISDTQEFNSTRDLFCKNDSCDPDNGDPLVGGAAQDMEGVRNLYTYLGTDPVLSNASNRVSGASADAITIGMLGAANEDERVELINWITRDPNFTPSEGDPSHAGVMGAPIHTQPIVVEYGNNNTETDDVVLIPTSEGVLEAIDAATGEELWAFMPADLLSNIRNIKNNAASDVPYYGLDGPMTVYETDNKKMVIFGMRRGGRKYHMLDITDRHAPKYVAEISSVASSDFSKLGQTWSKPLFVKIRTGTGDNGLKDALVFGGGYDPDQDDIEPNAVDYSDDEGNAIYIVDAADGTLLKSISNANADLNITNMTNAIPSDIATIDMNGNGVVERLYAADVGGRIIRVDIQDDDRDGVTPVPGTMSGIVIADINSGEDAHRKFFTTPQIGYFSQRGVNFLNILIGTGDITNPLDYTVIDRFYNIKDGYIVKKFDWSGFTSAVKANFRDASTAVVNLATAGVRGWYINFSSSEKAYSKAILYEYDIFFTTYSADAVTSDNLCEAFGSTGTAKIYGLKLLSAEAAISWSGNSENQLTINDRSSVLKMQGIPPSPSLVFPGRTDANGDTVVGKKVYLFADLKKAYEWNDRFRPIYWEEVINE